MTLAVSTTGWWIIGWAIGGAVVLVAAALLITIIALARRIVRQAEEITAALDGARKNTQALFDLAMVNHSLERITRGLHALRLEDKTGWFDKVASILRLDMSGRETTAGTQAE